MNTAIWIGIVTVLSVIGAAWLAIVVNEIRDLSQKAPTVEEGK